jgi:hypothetical protein
MDSAFHNKLQVLGNATLVCREDEFRLLYLTDIESDRYGTMPLSPYPPFGVVKLNETALEVRLHAFCGHRLDYSHWVWRKRGQPDLIDFGILSLARAHSHEQRPSWKSIVITRTCKFLSRLRRKLYTLWHLLFGILWPPGEALPYEKLSEIATRNIFSWTFFSDGVRLDELPMWEHEWLSFLLDHESDDGNASVTSGETA